MLKNYNYRFCVKASLQVMKEQRNRIYDDSQSNHLIYSGLHETNEELQTLYFQYKCFYATNYISINRLDIHIVYTFIKYHT